MEKVVRISVNDDGDFTGDERWHYVVHWDATDRALCTMEAFGIGDSGAEFKTKRGKITCDKCIRIINEFKKVKL